MPLARSTAIWGEHEIRHDTPAIRVVPDAWVVPQRLAPHLDPAWGVYDRGLRLVEDAALTRGPGRLLIGQSETSTPTDDPLRLPGTYLYGGSAQGHYGHYLLEFLPRYWAVDRLEFADLKILVHEMPGFCAWMSIPFVAETLGALGLTRERFVPVTEPAIVETLIVPAPASG